MIIFQHIISIVLLLLVPFLILDAKRVISVDSCTIYYSSSPYIISPFQLQEFYCQQNHVWSPTPSHRSHILPHASSRSPRVVNKGIPLFCTHFIFSKSILFLLRDIDYTSTIPSCKVPFCQESTSVTSKIMDTIQVLQDCYA